MIAAGKRGALVPPRLSFEITKFAGFASPVKNTGLGLKYRRSSF